MKSNRPNRRLHAERLECRNLLATFVVTSAFDGNPGDLRSAINMSNATPGIVDTIQINVPSIGLSLGEIAITDSVNIDAPGHVDIQAAPGSRIFNVDDGLPAQQFVTMNEVTLTGGMELLGGAILNHETLEIRNSTISGNMADFGGAIMNEGGLVHLDNVSVYGNSAYYEGGGLMNVGGALEILNSEIRVNHVTNNNGQPTYGGGIRNIGGALAILDNSKVLGNAAYASGGARAHGGGIAAQFGSLVHLIGSEVGENYATHEGGGIFVTDSDLVSQAHPTLGQLSSIFANISGEAGGGVYLNQSFGDMSDTTITGNTTELRGGGLSAGNDVTLFMGNVDVSNNTTNFFSADGSGGGLYLSGFGQPNGPDVTIQNSRIEGNNVNPNGSPGGEFGGGISARYGTTLTLADTVVENNKASSSGGGIYASGSFTPYAPVVTITDSTVLLNESRGFGGGMTMAGGSLNITNSHFDDNVTNDKGGGLFLTGLGSPVAQNMNIEIRDSTISGNVAVVEGGGIAAGPSMTLLIENSVMEANRTFGRGAALYATALHLSQLPNTTTIVDSTIRNNVAEYDPSGPPYSYASAGGIWSGRSADIHIESSTISGNSADRYGGGMMSNEALITLVDSTVDSNVAGVRGGGAYIKNSDVNFEQSTWRGNKAYDGGGAISLYSFLANVATITSNTISFNQADRDQDGVGVGGGIFVHGGQFNDVRVDIDHSIVARNFSDHQLLPYNDDIHDGPGLAGFAPVVSQYNLVGSQLGTTLAVANPDADGNIVGGSFFTVDPLLGPLMNNGGTTETTLPLPGSPAIDSGDPAALPGSFDQRNAPYDRVVNRQDMGSVEVQSSLPGPDLNFDGSVDVADIDLLTQTISFGIYDSAFDMDGDGVLDLTDVDRWLCKAGHTNLGPNLSYRVGDANLDGFVDGLDFIHWNANKFGSGMGWSTGDFNADGIVDGLDFIRWNANKFQGAFVCNPSPITNTNDSSAEPSLEAVTPARPGRQPVKRLQAKSSVPEETSLPVAIPDRSVWQGDRPSDHRHERRDRWSSIAIIDVVWAGALRKGEPWFSVFSIGRLDSDVIGANA